MSEHEAIRKALGMLITTLTAATMPKHHYEATARFRSRLTAYDITALLADRDRLAAEVEALRIPEGWKLVPTEPTMEMLKAGQWEEFYESSCRRQLAPLDDVEDVYRAMIFAAPASPEEGTS